MEMFLLYALNIENDYYISRVGAFLFVTMNMVFGNMSAIEAFIQERVIFV